MVLEKVDDPTNQGSPTAPHATPLLRWNVNFLICFHFPISMVCVLYICFSDSSIASPILSLSLSLSLSIYLSLLCVWERKKYMGSIEAQRTITGWAATDPTGILAPYTYSLRYLFQNHDLILWFSNFWQIWSTNLIWVSPKSNFFLLLQRHWPRRCLRQGNLLWNLPHWSSSDQEWSWHVQLSHGSWVHATKTHPHFLSPYLFCMSTVNIYLNGTHQAFYF